MEVVISADLFIEVLVPPIFLSLLSPYLTSLCSPTFVSEHKFLVVLTS